MKIKASDKWLHLSGIRIEFADRGNMYDLHDLRLQVHQTSPCPIDSSIPLTRPEIAKLGEALVLIQQRLNSEMDVPEDVLQD